MDPDFKSRLISESDKALDSMDAYAVDVEVESGRARFLLRVFIDVIYDERVTVADCAKATRLLESWFEEHAVITADYTMEVSSPGVERRIARPRDFKRFLGRQVRVRTRNPIEGRRNFQGTIADASEDAVTVTIGEDKMVFQYPDISRANLVYDFSQAEGTNGPKPR